MSEADVKKERKARMVKKVVCRIEVAHHAKGENADLQVWTAPTEGTLMGPYKDKADAQKDLCIYGLASKTYRIVKVMWEGQVAVEKVEKRKLS